MPRAIGLMSGTSLDGVDAAWIETDGVSISAFGPTLTVPYDDALRRDLRAILDRAADMDIGQTGDDTDPALADAVARLTEVHVRAVKALGCEADLIGFHGQTILHQPARRRTWQVGDAAHLARETGIPVACDFRLADVAAGGEGAPLVPVYHAALAQGLDDNGGVYLVPGFTGLGAPWWEAGARGAILGLTRDSTRAHLVRAGLEAMAYQTLDLLEALRADGAPEPTTLKVDGGVTANGWAMQFLADITGVPVERPAFQEMTALGAARLAALGAGVIEALEIASEDAPTIWKPRMAQGEGKSLLDGWRGAVEATLVMARRGTDRQA